MTFLDSHSYCQKGIKLLVSPYRVDDDELKRYHLVQTIFAKLMFLITSFFCLFLDYAATFQKEQLCKSCSRNQTYILQLLTKFNPEEEKENSRRNDVPSNGVNYSRFLDSRYPLCSSCASLVQLELQRQDRWLRSYILNSQLLVSKQYRTTENHLILPLKSSYSFMETAFDRGFLFMCAIQFGFILARGILLNLFEFETDVSMYFDKSFDLTHSISIWILLVIILWRNSRTMSKGNRILSFFSRRTEVSSFLVLSWLILCSLLRFQSNKILWTSFSLFFLFKLWNSSKKIKKSHLSPAKERLTSIKSIQDSSASIADIPSGGWFHRLTLTDEKEHRVQSVQDSHTDQEKKVTSSVNPFLKPFKLVDSITSSSKSNKLKRVIESIKAPTTDSSLIKESNWKKIALGLGKPFMRRIDHSSLSSSSMNSVTSFRTIVSQNYPLHYSQSNQISISPSSWPSSLPNSNTTTATITTRRSKQMNPIIYKPCLSQMDVNPPPDDLQMGFSNIHLVDTSSNDKLGRFRPLRYSSLTRINLFHRRIYWCCFGICFSMIVVFIFNQLIEVPMRIFVSDTIVAPVRMNLKSSSLFEKFVPSWNDWKSRSLRGFVDSVRSGKYLIETLFYEP